MIDVNKVEEEAKKELMAERFNSVKDKLVAKYKELEDARSERIAITDASYYDII